MLVHPVEANAAWQDGGSFLNFLKRRGRALLTAAAIASSAMAGRSLGQHQGRVAENRRLREPLRQARTKVIDLKARVGEAEDLAVSLAKRVKSARQEGIDLEHNRMVAALRRHNR